MQVGDRQIVLGPILGSGGYGEVYLATMRTPGGLESAVAVKVLHGDRGSSQAADRLRDEARLLFGIQHPSVVQALDLAWIAGRPALVTEYVPGLDLAECFDLDDPPPPKALSEIVLCVATALEAAYRGGSSNNGPTQVIHRDIKPSNVRVGRHGEVRLLDFGIATFSQAERHANTRTDVVVGSATYMAPERFVSRVSGPEVDIFGLGCCLYEGLTGQPFHDQSHLRELTAMSIAEERFREHHAARMERLAEVHPALRDITGRMLAFDASERPTASFLVDHLEAIGDAVGGPSLKRWCIERMWSEPTHVAGRLTGETIEGAGQREVPPPPVVRQVDMRGPKIVRVAPVTEDPAGGPSPDDVETVALARERAVSRRRRPSALLVLAGCMLPLGLGIAVAAAGAMVVVLSWAS